MNELILTDEEEKAIKALKKVALKWPKTLWLFSASGTLTVMKHGAGGEHAVTNNGAVDPNFVVDTVDIENDGGDW